MRKLLLIAAAGSALLAAGCATSGGYGGVGYVGGGYGYDYAGPSDVWYDGYYGCKGTGGSRVPGYGGMRRAAVG